MRPRRQLPIVLLLLTGVLLTGAVGLLFSRPQPHTRVTFRPSYGSLVLEVITPDVSTGTLLRERLEDTARNRDWSVMTLAQDGSTVILRTRLSNASQREVAIPVGQYMDVIQTVITDELTARVRIPRLLSAETIADGARLTPSAIALGFEFSPVPPGTQHVRLAWPAQQRPLAALAGATLAAGLLGHLLARALSLRLRSTPAAEQRRHLYWYSGVAQLPGAILIAGTGVFSVVNYLVFLIGAVLALLIYLVVAALVTMAAWFPFRAFGNRSLSTRSAGGGLLVVFPYLVYLAIRLMLTFIPITWPGAWGSLAYMCLDVAVLIVSFLVTPPLIPSLLRLSPCDSEKLQRALSALSVNPFKSAYLWRTGSSDVANAMVIGILPGASMLVVTEAAVQKLDEEEMIAILEHEAAHVRKAHLLKQVLIYLAFLTALNAIMGALGDAVSFVGSLSPAIVLVGYVPITRALGRRFELEADSAAASALGPGRKAWLARALEKLAAINGTMPVLFGTLLATHPPVTYRVGRIMGG